MAPATEADNNFDTHEWKSEFASTRSGRNSPNIFAKVRRKLLLTPPVRNARSPRLTEEELDALTGDLPYATNYTYAYSKIYDPSLPDHWEVPNLGGTTSGSLSEQEHWSAASLSRQLLYILRFPVYLVLHVITYILEAFYHVIKITSFTIWDYLLYLVKLAKTRYYAYQDHRRRTALIRNRQEPFSTKAARSIRRFFEILVYVVLTPYRMLTRSNNGVEQYQYRSIKDQLENERASRMTTRSQTLERSRKFDGLSKSPARRAAPAFVKTSTITRITAKVFSSSPFGEGTSENITPTVVTTRTVKQRSVTPRFRQTRATREAITRALDTPELEIDTPLSTYGLRSRGLSHLNTPEPTFDIGHAAATSTPLFPQETYNYQYEEATGNKIKTAFTWLGYLILFPFFAARHVWYTFYDYGKSAYMKLTNYQQAPMETIHVRDINEPAPSSSDVHDAVGVSWRIRIADFLSSFVATIVEAHQVVFAMFKGGIVETVSYFGGLFAGLTDKKSSKFSWCQILGLLLALLFAIFLLGFLTSDNTAIRVKEITKDKNASKKSEGSLPAVPIWISAANHVKHYTWMVKEFVVDIAFDTYNYGKSTIGRLGTTPRYAWDLIASGCGAVGNGLKSVLSSSFRFIDFCAGKLFYYGSDGFLSANKSIGTFFNGCYETLYNGCTAIVGHTKSFIYNASNAVYNFFSTIFAGLLNFSTSSQNSILSLLKSFGTGITNIFYNFIYAPIAGVFNFAGDNYMYFFNEVAAVFGKVYNSVVSVLKTVINWILFLIAYPFSLCTRAWIRISQYAPEDVVQVIPIPQAITPTPDVERIVEEPLRKVTDVEDEELVIIPAPAPKPIPVPAPTPAPVIIHQTNVVETVDKDAIIKEVTEKLRAELSAQFQQELSAKFEQNYNTIIEQLKMENTNIQYDKNHLEAIIRQMIYEYDTDKTGKVDYALESSGGAVVSTRCSETYKSYTRLEKFWDIPIYYFHYSPRVVIQRNSKSLFPGECWCFKESRGYIAVELSHFIDVSSISYEHIGSEVAPEGNRSSAPKGVLVWAYKQIDDLNSRVLIGDYTYDLDGPPLQFFLAKHKPDFPVKFVELEVTSNYGAPFTCLYRLRVHGKVVQV